MRALNNPENTVHQLLVKESNNPSKGPKAHGSHSDCEMGSYGL